MGLFEGASLGSYDTGVGGYGSDDFQLGVDGEVSGFDYKSALSGVGGGVLDLFKTGIGIWADAEVRDYVDRKADKRAQRTASVDGGSVATGALAKSASGIDPKLKPWLIGGGLLVGALLLYSVMK